MSRTILCLAALLAVALNVMAKSSEEEILMKRYAKVLDEANARGNGSHVGAPSEPQDIFQLIEGYKELNIRLELSNADSSSLSDNFRLARILYKSGRASSNMRAAIECFLLLDQLQERNERTCGETGKTIAEINTYLAHSVFPSDAQLTPLVDQAVADHERLCQ